MNHSIHQETPGSRRLPAPTAICLAPPRGFSHGHARLVTPFAKSSPIIVIFIAVAPCRYMDAFVSSLWYIDAVLRKGRLCMSWTLFFSFLILN